MVLREPHGRTFNKRATRAIILNYMYPPNGMTLTEEERTAGGSSVELKLQRSLDGL